MRDPKASAIHSSRATMMSPADEHMAIDVAPGDPLRTPPQAAQRQGGPARKMNVGAQRWEITASRTGAAIRRARGWRRARRARCCRARSVQGSGPQRRGRRVMSSMTSRACSRWRAGAPAGISRTRGGAERKEWTAARWTNGARPVPSLSWRETGHCPAGRARLAPDLR